MADQQSNTGIKERSKSQVREPRQYQVILHNDNFTPMDFVVMALMKYFNKSFGEAQALMLQVHRQGKSVAGIYSYDIAMTKAAVTMRAAREAGYPLKLTCSPA